MFLSMADIATESITQYFEKPMIDDFNKIEAKKDDNSKSEVIEVTEEYFDEHPEQMNKLVQCYRDTFGQESPKKENGGVFEWGEYLRCKNEKCRKGIGIKTAFGLNGEKYVNLEELNENEVLDKKCPYCGGEFEFWHDREQVKELINYFLDEEIQQNTHCVLLKENDENRKVGEEAKVTGFIFGMVQDPREVVYELQHHINIDNKREARGFKELMNLSKEQKLEREEINEALKRHIPNYDELRYMMHIPDFGILKSDRDPRNVVDLSKAFFAGFREKLIERGIKCDYSLLWTAEDSRVSHIVRGLGMEEIYHFSGKDIEHLTVFLIDINKMLKELEKSPLQIGRKILAAKKLSEA